jgi:hypothetical protein
MAESAGEDRFTADNDREFHDYEKTDVEPEARLLLRHTAPQMPSEPLPASVLFANVGSCELAEFKTS